MKGYGRLVAVVLIAFLGLFTASSAHAEKEQLNAYTIWSERYANAIFSAFTKDTGIKVNWMRFSSGEVQARLEAEKTTLRLTWCSAIWPRRL